MAHLRTTLAVLLLLGAGCSRPDETAAPAAEPAPPVAAPSAPARPAPSFAVGDQFEVTTRLTVAQAPVRVETSVRYRVRVEAVEPGAVRAEIEVLEDETVIHDASGARRTRHPVRRIAFRGTTRELALIGASRSGSLLATHLPPERPRDGARWSGTRELRVGGLPLELALRSCAASRPGGRLAVTTTSRGSRPVELGVTLSVEGEAVSVFDAGRRDLPRSIRGRFTTLAAGGPGEDARSTVAIDVRTRRLS